MTLSKEELSTSVSEVSEVEVRIEVAEFPSVKVNA